MTDNERRKPTGKTGPVSFGADGVLRRWVEFPAAKADIEMFIAELFCAAKSGMRPQMARYSRFTDLTQQPEDRPDFTVRTGKGDKWLELAEFAPLSQFGHRYENVPASWDASVMLAAIRSLVDKKAKRGYGSDVILVIYKTHETLFVPPPILRALTVDLASASVPFEAIYFVSPHDQESASTWEIYPGNPVDDGWVKRTGPIRLGFGGFEGGALGDGADQSGDGSEVEAE